MPKSFQRFTLNVTLQHIDPPIWRRIEVEGTESLRKLHHIESEPWGEAQVIDGARACPPEDVGGPRGYEAFLDTLSDDPDSEQAARYRNWIGPGFDAELFDLRAANAALLRMASNRWGNR